MSRATIYDLAATASSRIRRRVDLIGRRQAPRSRLYVVEGSGVKLYDPWLPLEVGNVSGIHKYNLVIEDPTDPFHFAHYLPFFWHPEKLNPAWPILLFIPGLLCNSSHPRIVPFGGQYKDLNEVRSLVNFLVLNGCRILLANPPHTKHLNKRYVARKLGVENNFHLSGINFHHLSDQLDFYCQVTPWSLQQAGVLNGVDQVVMWPYSYGTIKQLDNVLRNGVNHNLAGQLIFGPPTSLSPENFIMGLAELAAGIFPAWTGVQPLNTLADKLHHFKPLLRKLPDFMVRNNPIIANAFYPPNTNEQAIFDVVSYVLESAVGDTVERFIEWIKHEGGVVSRSNGESLLAQAAKNDKLRALPSRVVVALEDHLALPEDGKIVGQALGCEVVEMEKTGHGDLLMGHNYRDVGAVILDFMAEYYAQPA